MCQRKIKGAGSSQDGSLRAQKILYEDRSAAFEAIVVSDLEMPFGSEQHLWRKDLRRERFSLVICPLAETSIQKNDTSCVRERSATRGAYFSVL